MLASPRAEQAVAPALPLPQVALIILLAGLLAMASLAQLFAVVPYPNLFIRVAELLFVGTVLITARASYEAPVLPRAAGVLLVGWLLAASIAVALATHLGPALVYQAELLAHLAFGVALWQVARHEPLVLKVVLLMIPLGFLLVGLHTLTTWFTLSNPRDYNWFTSVPLIGHIRHFGYYALAGLIFSAAPLLGLSAEAIGRSNRWGEALAFGAMTLCWGFVFWSGGRAAMGAGLVGVALVVLFVRRGRRLRAVGIAVAACVLGFWLSTFFIVNDGKLGATQSLERTALDTAEYGVNGFLTGRLNIWGEALAAFAERPWFGLGPNNYKFLPIQAHGGIQPHSLLVQFLLDWGVFGALPFLALLVWAGWQGVVRTFRERDALRRAARVTALAFLVGATLHSLVDGLYYYAQPLLFIVTCFAIVLLPASGARPARSGLRFLTARTTLWVALVALALVFLLNSNFVYRLLA